MLKMSQLLQRAEESFGGHPAMLESGRSWRDHVARLRLIAGAFGLGPGKRFAVIAPNSETQAELLHAGYLSGAIPIPMNWRLSPAEMTLVLKDCSPDLVFLDAEFEHLRSEVTLKVFREKAISIGRTGVNDAVLQGVTAAPDHAAVPDDLALIVYTGGTTGLPKGVCLSHGNITSNALQVAPILKFDNQSRYLHLAPMFHSADLLGTAVTMLGGAHLYLPSFDADGFLRAARAHRITATMMVPAIARVLADHGGDTLSDLRMLIYGSSPMDAALIRQTCARFPSARILQGYGLTETSPLLSILGAEEHRKIAQGSNPGPALSAGRPLPGVELRVVGQNGRSCERGEPGEIEARGPNIAINYFRNPTETEAAFRDGWFRTGDIGRIDDEGYLYLLDRAKDMIITGGENVFSIQVENVLLAHPEVAEASVIGLRHPKWGEELTAVIVASSPEIDIEALQSHCREKLAGYKVPRRFFFVDALPRNALGKVLKHQLRAEMEESDG